MYIAKLMVWVYSGESIEPIEFSCRKCVYIFVCSVNELFQQEPSKERRNSERKTNFAIFEMLGKSSS